MRIVLQRVSQAAVAVAGREIARIGRGLLLLVGVAPSDTDATVDQCVAKIVNLRIFEDADGKMNLSLAETGGEALVVSQFTLYADCRKGRRPSFTDAAQPAPANKLYQLFAQKLRVAGIPTRTGEFAAHMQVHLVNDGPVTIWLDSGQIG